MIYLLDTNTCIHAIRTNGNPLVKARLIATPPSEIAICTVVLGELYYGAERSGNIAIERRKVDSFVTPYSNLPYDQAASSQFGIVRADLSLRGLSIGPLDTMIAAIALANGLKLVTHNTAQFSRITGLSLVDWEIP